MVLRRALYISHGGGPLPLLGDASHTELVACLRDIAASIERPAAIIVVSAHWEAPRATMTAGDTPALIYDYYGFPPESYEIEYPCPGAPQLAQAIYNHLRAAGIDAALDTHRGFDHGLFVPLKIMYPEADIPCVQLSLLDTLDPVAHIALGRALQVLADRSLLLIGSGSSFHNLQAFFRPDDAKLNAMNHAFEQWLLEACGDRTLTERERQQRLEHWPSAPFARACHPREEHLLPLHVCYGYAGAACTKSHTVHIGSTELSMYLWETERHDSGAMLPMDDFATPAFAHPKLHADGSVEFSFLAPNATSVKAQGDFGNLPLTRQDDGRWTGSTALRPEIYRYVFDVDGILTPDPDNLNIVVGYGAGFPMSYFEVPGDGSQAYEFRKDVVYGRIERVNYYSPVLQRMRQMHVFTPREYDEEHARQQQYPVLYLLGGIGESDSQWSSVGRAGVILENLITDGKALPMLVVMPNNRIDEPGQVNPPAVDIGDELFGAILPYVDKHYRTRADRHHRALAGLSMGGLTVLQHGLTHLDQFACLGVFSSGLFGGVPPYEAAHQDVLTDPSTNQRLQLLWYALGTQDFVYPIGKATLALLDKYGIEYQYYENTLGHDWFSWREFLTAFVPLLFRGKDLQ